MCGVLCRPAVGVVWPPNAASEPVRDGVQERVTSKLMIPPWQGLILKTTTTNSALVSD